MKKSIVTTGALILAALTLTSCAGSGPTFASPSELHKAYLAAGGDCGTTTEVPESMVSDGAHALMCPDVTFLIVFDSEDAKNRYLARTLDGKNDLEAVVGERWAVMTTDADKYADKLGGKATKG